MARAAQAVPEIHCRYDELIDPAALQEHPKNRNKHNKDQIDRLADLFRYHGIRHPIIVSKRSDCIVAGHGRRAAALKAKFSVVPVVFQDFESDEAEYAFIQSDNAIALWAELDLAGINADIGDLGPDFDLDMLGIKDFAVDVADRFEDGEDNPYTAKIEAPVYEPTGERPEVKELCDLDKTRQLLSKIDAAPGIPDEVREFLRHAAQRHTVFNYAKIAEFYAHADETLQDLMEQSALVIIDFDKAIEGGFVALTKDLGEEYARAAEQAE